MSAGHALTMMAMITSRASARQQIGGGARRDRVTSWRLPKMAPTVGAATVVGATQISASGDRPIDTASVAFTKNTAADSFRTPGTGSQRNADDDFTWQTSSVTDAEDIAEDDRSYVDRGGFVDTIQQADLARQEKIVDDGALSGDVAPASLASAAACR